MSAPDDVSMQRFRQRNEGIPPLSGGAHHHVQVAKDAYLRGYLEDASRCMRHAQRTELMHTDLQLLDFFKEKYSNGNLHDEDRIDVELPERQINNLIREIARSFVSPGKKLIMAADSYEPVHLAAEMYLRDNLDDAYRYMRHAGREELRVADFRLVRHFKKKFSKNFDRESDDSNAEGESESELDEDSESEAEEEDESGAEEENDNEAEEENEIGVEEQIEEDGSNTSRIASDAEDDDMGEEVVDAQEANEEEPEDTIISRLFTSTVLTNNYESDELNDEMNENIDSVPADEEMENSNSDDDRSNVERPVRLTRRRMILSESSTEAEGQSDAEEASESEAEEEAEIGTEVEIKEEGASTPGIPSENEDVDMEEVVDEPNVDERDEREDEINENQGSVSADEMENQNSDVERSNDERPVGRRQNQMVAIHEMPISARIKPRGRPWRWARPFESPTSVRTVRIKSPGLNIEVGIVVSQSSTEQQENQDATNAANASRHGDIWF